MMRRPPRSTLFPYPPLSRSEGNDNTVRDCFIGTDAAGMSARPNTAGIYIANGSRNIIANNLVSGQTNTALIAAGGAADAHQFRSEEHTSELQSQSNLACRLL